MTPASRAQVPRGRHARTGPNAPAQGRHARPSQASAAQPDPVQERPGRIQTRRSIGPLKAARATTVRKGGQHALMAEFLFFLAIVTMRAVADYVPADQGQPTEGTSKGTVTPRGSQQGPLVVLAAGFVIFFILSFLAARGGGAARIAAMAGLIIDVALLLRSLPELETVAGGFGNARQQAQQAQAGTIPPPGTTAAGGYPGRITEG